MISLVEGARRLSNRRGEFKEQSLWRRQSSTDLPGLTRHIEAYRYEVQHSDDADIVAYQRKSRDGVWRTISAWMIPQPVDY
jgi:hypothetical protein